MTAVSHRSDVMCAQGVLGAEGRRVRDVSAPTDPHGASGLVFDSITALIAK